MDVLWQVRFLAWFYSVMPSRVIADKRQNKKCLCNQRMRYTYIFFSQFTWISLYISRSQYLQHSQSDLCDIFFLHFVCFNLILSHCRETPFYLLCIAQCIFSSQLLEMYLSFSRSDFRSASFSSCRSLSWAENVNGLKMGSRDAFLSWILA